MNAITSLIRLMRFRAGGYALAIALLIVSTVLFLFMPPLLGEFVERVSSGSPRSAIAVAAIIAAIMLGQNSMMALYGYVLARISESLGNLLRQNFFDNIVADDIDRLVAKRSGALASEFASDLAIVQTGLSDTLITLLRHSLFTVGALGAMLWVNWQLGAVTLVSVGLVAVLIYGFVRLIGKASLAVQSARAEAVAHFVEAVANALVIRAYGREAWFSRKFGARLDETWRQIVRQSKIIALVNPVSMVCFSLAVLAILWFGAIQIEQGALEIAGLIAFVTYAVILVSSISQVGVTLGRLRQAAIIYEKHADYLNPYQHREDTEASAPTFGVGPIGLSLRRVSFAYLGSSTNALEGIDCNIPKGEVTGLVGPSGSGKSTLVSLVCGIFRPSSGTIVGDGGAWPPRCEDVAIVPQNPFLFAGSVYDNVAMGRSGISLERVQEACRQVHIERTIMDFGGYDFVLHEGARNLSRGQQQRLALARALAGNPRLLVLDEATASLDVANELAVKQALSGLRGRVTVLIVAHQGDLLKDLDRLIRIEDGRIVYEGAPPELAIEGVAR